MNHRGDILQFNLHVKSRNPDTFFKGLMSINKNILNLHSQSPNQSNKLFLQAGAELGQAQLSYTLARQLSWFDQVNSNKFE